MKYLVALLGACVVLGCGSSGSSGGGDGGSGGLAGSGAGGTGAAAGSGAASGTGASAGQAGAGGSAGSAGTPGCSPTPGTDTLQAHCDQVRVAVIDDGGSQRLQIRARVTSTPTGACNVVDEIELGQSGAVLQTISAAGAVVPEDYNDVLLETEASSAVTALCADESQRIEPFGFRIKGRTDGGSFEAACGKAGSGSGWPPSVVLTCHAGIEEAPFGGNSMVQTVGPSMWTDLYAFFPHSPGKKLLKSGDPSIRILPAAWSYGGLTLSPFDTTGWSADVNETNVGGKDHSQLSFNVNADPLGVEVCPPYDNNNPTPDPSPVYIAKVTGTTSDGAFSSEIFVDVCTRAPASP